MKTLLIDGNNAVWRIANGLSANLTVNGVPIQVVYGFMRLLHSMLEDFEPDKAIVFWDSGKPEYRIGIYQGYKKRRFAKRDEASKADKQKRSQTFAQIEVIQDLLPLLGVYQVDYENTEADDLIAVASQMNELGLRIIISGDQDFLQLVKRGVRVFFPSRHQLYRHTTFKKLVGLTPQQWLEYRILTGDHSDEIPSVIPGFGEKTAMQLIKQYATIGNLLTNGVRKKVEERGKRFARFYSPGVVENIERNYKLMRLDAVHNQKKLKEHTRNILSVCLGLDQNAVKKAFLDRRFVSLLAGFSTWLIPFKNLTP
jgi:DNA polymerase I